MKITDIQNPFPEIYSDSEWMKYVREGRDLVDEETRIQFKLGDLVLNMIPFAERDGRDHNVNRILDRYSSEIGTSAPTLHAYRNTAHAWPPEHRVPGVPWTVCRTLSGSPDRFKAIQAPPPRQGAARWTCDDAARYVGRTPDTPVSDEERIDRVRSLIRTDEDASAVAGELLHRQPVAEQMMENPSTRRAMLQANMNRLHRRSDDHSGGQTTGGDIPPARPSHGSGQSGTTAREANEQRRPLPADTAASRQVLELLGLGVSFYTSMQTLIPKLDVSGMSDDARHAIYENHKRVRAIVDWCDTVVKTGDTSMDDQLARLLEGDD